MRKKIIFLSILLISLTGCTSQYNLEFSNGKIKEEIITTILPTDIPKKAANAVSELDDRVTPFINNDQYPIFDNTKIKYDKKVKKVNDSTIVTLKHNYSHDEFRKSNTFKSCFRYSSFKENYKNYDLVFSGDFYCLYGDEVEINIKTNNIVISNNADKVSGNTYTWIINRKNLGNVDINMKISKKSNVTSYIIYVIIGVIVVVLAGFGYTAYKIIKNREEVNKI